MADWKITSYNPVTKETVCTDPLSKNKVKFTIPAQHLTKEDRNGFIKSQTDTFVQSVRVIPTVSSFHWLSLMAVIEAVVIAGLLLKVFL